MLISATEISATADISVADISTDANTCQAREVPAQKQKDEGTNKVIVMLILQYPSVFGICYLYRLRPVKSQGLLQARMLLA